MAPSRPEAVERAILSISTQHRYHMPKLQVAKLETRLPVLDDLVDDVSDFVTTRGPSGGQAKPHLAG